MPRPEAERQSRCLTSKAAQRNVWDMIVRGGKTIASAAVGILMLESRFPRIPGDGGNASTWPFPLLYKVVTGATPERVVERAAEGLLDDFIAGGRELVAAGADGITTNCGFLTLYQPELSAALNVPVASSSLLQAAWIQALLPPGRQVGVVTISAASLTEGHFERAGIPPGTPVAGTDREGMFAGTILGDRLELDVDAARSEVVGAAVGLVEAHPSVGALVLECTNMSPYSADVAAETGLPVYDFVSFLSWFHAGLRPRRFPVQG